MALCYSMLRHPDAMCLELCFDAISGVKSVSNSIPINKYTVLALHRSNVIQMLNNKKLSGMSSFPG